MIIKESWQLHFITVALLMSVVMIVWQLIHLSPRYTADDSALTVKIKRKLSDNPALGALAISVDTERGIVQLSGLARSVTEAKEAEKLASETDGVVAVRNYIHPKSPLLERGCQFNRIACEEDRAARIETPKGINLVIHPVLWTEQTNLN